MTKKQVKSDSKNTEKTILNAASEVFIEKGYEGARMQEIADRAGLNKALLHYYYRSKDRLFNAVFEVVIVEMVDSLSVVFNKDVSVFNRIREFFDKHQMILSQNHLIPLFMLNEIHRDPELLLNVYNLKNVSSFEVKFFRDIVIEQEMGIIRSNINPIDLFMNILSLSIFPFAAKPLLMGFYDIGETEYNSMTEGRKSSLAEFVIESIKNRD
jgi:AcrR family transcriptional regulator